MRLFELVDELHKLLPEYSTAKVKCCRYHDDPLPGFRGFVGDPLGKVEVSDCGPHGMKILLLPNAIAHAAAIQAGKKDDPREQSRRRPARVLRLVVRID
jgi:hypothetical protein